MRFAEEIWLWVVPLLPLLWWLLRWSDNSAQTRLHQLLGDQVARQVEGAQPRLRSWRRFFLVAGLFWLLLALARPQWGASEVTVTQQGSDIVVALDISNSMLAEDVVPNRMERAKAELGSFLNRLENSRVGLVFFAGASFVQCPLTLDYGTAEIFLKMAGPDMMSEQGTAIGAALKASRELLAKGRGDSHEKGFQAILLVTDGEDLEGDWESEARACRDDGIRVIPVGVGEKGGGLIPVFDAAGRPAGFMKDEEGNVVMTRMDLAKLEELAAIGGGSAFRLGVDRLAGDRLFAELKRLGRRDMEERRISAYQERFVWPLLLALICFCLRLLVKPRKKATEGRAALSALILASFVLTGIGETQAGLIPPELSEMNKGAASYEAGEFEAALAAFEAALVQAPDHPTIGLAVGETLYRLERYEEAAGEFERVVQLSDDPEVRAEALFNLGTTRLAAGDPAQAVADLRESLAQDPSQDDALFNLEVALQRLKQQEQEEQEQEQDEDQEQDQQKQEEENQDQEDQEQQDQEQQQDEQEQQDQEQKDKSDEENEDEEQQSEPEEEQSEGDQPEEQQSEPEPQESEDQEELDPEQLTKEQQEQILQALDRDEEELKRSVQKRLKGGKPKSGKKW